MGSIFKNEVSLIYDTVVLTPLQASSY